MMFNYFILLCGLFIFIMNITMLVDKSYENSPLNMSVNSALASLGGVLIAVSMLESFQ